MTRRLMMVMVAAGALAFAFVGIARTTTVDVGSAWWGWIPVAIAVAFLVFGVATRASEDAFLNGVGWFLTIGTLLWVPAMALFLLLAGD